MQVALKRSLSSTHVDAKCQLQASPLPLAICHLQFRFTVTGTTTLVFERPTATAVFAGLEPATQVSRVLLRLLVVPLCGSCGVLGNAAPACVPCSAAIYS